jgi:calcium-translocating P-type ATPase
MDFITLSLLFLALIFALVGVLKLRKLSGGSEGIIIVAYLFLIALLKAFNEYSKEKKFIQLRELTKIRTCMVKRNKEIISIKETELLVGDILVISPGTKLQYDALLVKGEGVKVDESALTGEVMLMAKNTGTNENPEDCFMLSGTQVSNGDGEVLVCLLESESTMGQVSSGLQVEPEESPLQIKLEHIAEPIMRIVLLAAIILVVTLIISFIVQSNRNIEEAKAIKSIHRVIECILIGFTVLDTFGSLRIIMIFTALLASIVRKLADNGILVKQLSAVEKLGMVNNICLDKNGVVTKGKMEVFKVLVDEKIYNASQSADAFSPLSKKMLFTNIILNTDEITINCNKKMACVGSNIENAFIEYADMQHCDYKKIQADNPIVHTVPFSSQYKYKLVIARGQQEGTYTMLVRGALDIVLQYCTKLIVDGKEEELSQVHKDKLSESADKWKLCRVIGLASKVIIAKDMKEPQITEMLNSLTLDGICAFNDPINDGVVNGIRSLSESGITVRMATGDNQAITEDVGYKSGIISQKGFNPASVIAGAQFDQLVNGENPKGENQPLQDVRVIYRASPSVIYGLVGGLKKDPKNIQMMMGSGTCDVPAMKLADIGIAAEYSTDMAKQSANLLQINNYFGSIIESINLGRNLYSGIRKCILYEAISTFVPLLIFIASALFKGCLPLTISQMLYTTVLYSVISIITHTSDKMILYELNQPPYTMAEDIITPKMKRSIAIQVLYQVLMLGMILFYTPLHIWLFKNPVTHAIEEAGLLQAKVNFIIFNVLVFSYIFSIGNASLIINRSRGYNGSRFGHIQLGGIFAHIVIAAIMGALMGVQLDALQMIFCLGASASTLLVEMK